MVSDHCLATKESAKEVTRHRFELQDRYAATTNPTGRLARIRAVAAGETSLPLALDRLLPRASYFPLVALEVPVGTAAVLDSSGLLSFDLCGTTSFDQGEVLRAILGDCRHPTFYSGRAFSCKRDALCAVGRSTHL